MNRTLVIVLSATLLALSGCGKKKNDAETKPTASPTAEATQAPETPTPEPTTTPDVSENTENNETPSGGPIVDEHAYMDKGGSRYDKEYTEKEKKALELLQWMYFPCTGKGTGDLVNKDFMDGDDPEQAIIDAFDYGYSCSPWYTFYVVNIYDDAGEPIGIRVTDRSTWTEFGE